jgi:type I restriction enzyme S subunit
MVNQWVTSSKGVGDIQRDIFVPWLKKAKVVIPPPDEQELIVRFLDWASVRLEKAIRAKLRVIALLEEKRKVIIQSAITETIGDDCPTVPIRAMLRPVKRLGYPDKMILSLFRDYGVIPKESRENKNVDVRDLALCQLVEPGDVVMNKMKAWQGSIAVSELEGIASPDYMVLKFQMGPVVDKFFHYVLRSPEMIADYRRNAYGVRPGQWRLMYQEFSRLRLPLPTEDVQQEVVDQITTQTKALDNAIASEQKQMKLIREYRTRLISDVVTGKLDVRDVARSLPSESEEIELIDDLRSDEDIDTEFDDELEAQTAEQSE